jgi:hypothetical protein
LQTPIYFVTLLDSFVMLDGADGASLFGQGGSMQRRIFCGLFFWAICSLGAIQSLRAAPAFEGMSYTTDFSQAGNDLGSAASQQSLLSMSQMGANTVAINVWWFTPTITSTTIAPDYTRYSTQDTSLETAINYVHSLGMKVVLKPMLDVDNGTWRANINPSSTNRNAWFSNYSTFIDHYATIAQNYNVEMLSVGCELCDMEQYSSNWTTVINNARSIYNGSLTYSANWSPNGSLGGYQNISWWNQLNEVGIDAYFPLTGTADPSQAALQTAWTNEASSLHSWLTTYNNAHASNLKMLFTETGYASYSGTNETPYSGPASSSTPVDLTEQANCYQALLSVMSQQNWWDGAMFWNWTSNPNDGGTSNNNYTPQYKPAQQVASQFYLLRGDFDLNHKIDNGDLQAMLNALKNESSFESTHYFSAADLNALGDFNSDGVLDAADIQGELNLIIDGSSGGGQTSTVPEPASVVLLGLAVLMCPAISRRRYRA